MSRLSDAHKIGRGVFLLMLLAACGRSSGCGGCDTEGTPFPNKDRVHSAIQVRLTDNGVGFLEDNLEPLLSQALPEGGLNICLPGQGGDIIGLVQWGFCQEQCADGSQGCQINIGIGNIDLALVETSRVRATLTFSELAAAIDIFANPIVDCRLSINGAGFPVTVDLNLSTPEPSRDLTFAVENPVYQLSDLDIRLMGDGGGLSFLCDLIDGVINFPLIGDLLLGAIQGFVDGALPGLIGGFVDDFTCRTCEGPADCPAEGGAVCDGGRCVANGRCLPAPLGIQGVLDTGALLSSFAPGLEAQIQYLLTPGSYVDVENEGLSLGIIGGATAELNRCVPPQPQPPSDVEPPRAVALSTNLDPGGLPYEVGIGVSELFTRHLMWSVYSSGTLCLAINGETIPQLSMISLLLPDLDRLTHGNKILAITLSPQDVPSVTFGSNTVVPDPDDEGQYTLQDPLATIRMNGVWLDFHTFTEDRWVRIFSLSTDLVIPLGLAFTPENALIPVLGDLGMALQNMQAHNGEVMRDDPGRIAALLPALIGPLLPSLLDGLSGGFALPDIIGYRLDLQDHSILGIENNQFLGIFANLERADAQGMPEGMAVEGTVDTEVEVAEVHVPPTEAFEPDALDAWRRPYVRLKNRAFDARRPADGEAATYEYQWRVNGGSWSLFTPATEMVVRNPQFLLQGKFDIEVRARRADDYHTLDATPATVQVVIDSRPPTLEVVESGTLAEVTVADLVSARESLQVEYRYGDGAWSLLAPETAFVNLPTAENGDLTVRATDEGGNVSTATLAAKTSGLIGRASHDERTNPEAAAGGCGSCGGCVVPGRSTPGPAGFLALLPLTLGLGLRRRGRNGRLGLILIAAAALFVVGCDDSTSKKIKGNVGDAGVTRPDTGIDPDDGIIPIGDCDDDADCGNGRVCRLVAGVNRCVQETCGEDPAVCAEVQCPGDRKAICAETGLCECEQPCPEGCGDGEYCCRATYACAPLPVACVDLTCEPGFEPMVFVEGMVNQDTCMLENADCQCIEKAPLDRRSVGRFSDMVVSAAGTFVSAYADTYGDLVVGRWDDVSQTIAWWWVDGVPAGAPVVGGPSGPRGGVELAGPDVGTYTSLAVGPNGELHVAYRDEEAQALKYAFGAPTTDGYTFTTLTLDTEGDAGRWTSISVDPRGVPGIAYRVARKRDADAWVSEVRYALAKNSTPDAEGDWLSPFTIARSVLDGGCGGLCGRGEACVASTNTCAQITQNCEGGCADGQACIAGVCEATLEIVGAGGTYPEGTGLFTSQTRDLTGFPVVAWYDRTFGQLWWSRFVDAGFTEPQQLAGYGIGVETREGDMGANVDVAVDAQGNSHLCYQDGNTDSLRYLAPELGLDEWVDDGIRENDGRPWALHVVGEDCNVRVDPAGNPLIVYQDATNQDVVLARRSAEGAWSRTTLRGDEFEYRGAYGFYTRARIFDATLWVSSYWWNNQDPARPDGVDVIRRDL